MRYYGILVLALFAIFSCGSEKDKELSKSYDSLKTALENAPVNDSSGNISPDDYLNKLILDFGSKYRVSGRWNRLSAKNSGAFIKELTGNYIVVPVTSEQITDIIIAGFTEKSVVFMSEENSAYVFDIDGSSSELENFPAGKTALLLLKVNSIKEKPKLYLEKQGKDFRHTEHRVTEFYFHCILIDAASVNLTGEALLKQYNLYQF